MNIVIDVRNKFFCDVECFDYNRQKPQTTHVY